MLGSLWLRLIDCLVDNYWVGGVSAMVIHKIFLKNFRAVSPALHGFNLEANTDVASLLSSVFEHGFLSFLPPKNV